MDISIILELVLLTNCNSGSSNYASPTNWRGFFILFLKELRLFSTCVQPLGFADGCVDHFDDLQAIAVDQAGTGMGLVRSRQSHQQLVGNRVPLDGAARLERPWLQGPAL